MPEAESELIELLLYVLLASLHALLSKLLLFLNLDGGLLRQRQVDDLLFHSDGLLVLLGVLETLLLLLELEETLRLRVEDEDLLLHLPIGLHESVKNRHEIA